MNKEEKRKMKTLELNSKEDFQYYLYRKRSIGGTLVDLPIFLDN